MNPNDEPLHRLLQSWADVEPRANFEANVRRRLRQEKPEPVRSGWFWQPAFAVVAAVIVASAIGTWSGIRSTVRPEATGFLAADTLTGRYLDRQP